MCIRDSFLRLRKVRNSYFIVFIGILIFILYFILSNIPDRFFSLQEEVMKNLQIFVHPVFGEIRILSAEGVCYACSEDIAHALNYPRSITAIMKHCKHPVTLTLQERDRTVRDILCIGCEDIHRLIDAASSEHDAFACWFFGTVLPCAQRAINRKQPTRTFSYFIKGKRRSGSLRSLQ